MFYANYILIFLFCFCNLVMRNCFIKCYVSELCMCVCVWLWCRNRTQWLKHTSLVIYPWINPVTSLRLCNMMWNLHNRENLEQACKCFCFLSFLPSSLLIFLCYSTALPSSLFFLCVSLATKPRALRMLGKFYHNELYQQSYKCFFNALFLQDQSMSRYFL